MQGFLPIVLFLSACATIPTIVQTADAPPPKTDPTALLLKGLGDAMKGSTGAKTGDQDPGKMLGNMLKTFQSQFSTGDGKKMLDSIKGLFGEEGKKKLAQAKSMLDKAGDGKGGKDTASILKGILASMQGPPKSAST